MFTVFQSQRMEQLASQLVQRLGERRHGELTLEPDTILIQHAGMTRWLKMQLARQSGIAANLDCTFPAAFLWRVYQAVLADLPLTDETRYSAPQLTWSIMGLLPELIAGQPDTYALIKEYLDQARDHQRPGEEQLQRLQLSARLAGLYEQYLLYRGDWISHWEAGEEVTQIPPVHRWQAHLWQGLKDTRKQLALPPGPHRVEIHRQFLARLGQLPNWPANLPRQVSIFGISSLPPELLEALAMIGAREDVVVDLYLMNPCNHYWGDIVPQKTIARKNLKQLLADKALTADDDYLLFGNPLLASMGQEGKEFIDQLWDIPHLDLQELEDPVTDRTPDKLTMLQFLQQEIHDLTLRGEMEPLPPELAITNQGKLTVAGADQSIEISSCYGAMREVEVLYDRVLNLLDKDPGLTPRDILVMAPDIGFYAPFIEAVFNSSAPGQLALPYNISDRSLGEESAICASFLKLLALPDSRFAASEILDLVTVDPIARQFGFDGTDNIETLTRWITESGIRWGIDGTFKQQEWQLANVNNHSWAFGFDRLLLGYAMESSEGLFDQVLPYSNHSGSDGQLLGQLISFLGRLQKLHRALKTPRKLVDWQTLLNRIIREFYQQDPDTALEFRQIQQSIDQLVQLAQDNGVEEAFHCQAISYWMTEQLQQPAGGHGFLSRGITFCNLVAMRNIPARVVCLIGMNDTDFPRRRNSPGFDLLAMPDLRRRGDRSHRQDDRYMFLEALLAATQHLYISYIGRDNQDDKEREASVLVTEVLDYCERAFTIPGDDRAKAVRDHLVTAYPLQPFSPRYYTGDSGDRVLATYSRQWWCPSPTDSSGVQSLYAKLKAAGPVDGMPLTGELTNPVIELEELVAFYRNPAQYFFNRCLNIVFPRFDDDISDEEPFSLDTLESYQLMVEQLTDPDRLLQEWLNRQQASGRVLPGDAGRNQLIAQRHKLSDLRERLQDLTDKYSAPATLDISTIVEGYRLQGQVNNVHTSMLVQARPAEIKARDRLSGWIRLLALQAAGGTADPCTLILLGIKGDGYRYDVDPETARSQLQSLILLYQKGQKHPLFFLPETSLRWQLAKRDNADDDIAGLQALKGWESDRFSRGESADSYLYRTFSIPADFDDEFGQTAACIYQPLLDSEKRITAKGKL